MFSPVLFYDYYWANNFTHCQAFLVESGRGDPSFIKWKLFKYEYNSDHSIAKSFKSRNAIGVFFVGRKTDSSTAGIIPIQYQFMDRVGRPEKNKLSGPKIDRVKRRTPVFVKSLYHRFYRLINKCRGGLKYLGRI